MNNVAPSRYVLLDANVIAAYYAPDTLDKKPAAAERVTSLIDAVRKLVRDDVKLLAPSICIAEAYTVLSKHAHPEWRGLRKRKRDVKGAIHARTYKKLRAALTSDTQNARLIESIDINRYHVLARHFIAPIDHNTFIPGRDGKGRTSEMGGTDQLIIGMGIWLARLLGRERFCILTADYRLWKVLRRAAKVTPAQAEKWGLLAVADEIKMPWSTHVYPCALHVENSTDADFRAFFGMWPIVKPSPPPRGARQQPRPEDLDVLVNFYRSLSTPRDRLPYTDRMRQLARSFAKHMGRDVTEAEAWRLLLDRLKRGSGRLGSDAKGPGDSLPPSSPA
jgi:hypothetical protein